MADFTLCRKTTCEKRDLCYRYVCPLINLHWQDYDNFPQCNSPNYERFMEISGISKRMKDGNICVIMKDA